MDAFPGSSFNRSASSADEDGSGRTPAAIILTIYVSIVFVVGSVGNLLTIYTVASVRALRKTANMLVASLAVSDAGCVFVSIPVIYSRLRFPEFNEGHPLFCKVSYFSMLFFVAVSVNHMQVIAFNRYVIVTVQPRTYRKYCGSMFSMFLFICTVWMYGLLLICLPFVGFGDIEYIPELGGCGIVETTRLSWWYKTCLLSTVVQSCGVLTPIFFVLTFKKIYTAKRRLENSPDTVEGAVSRFHARPRGFSKHEMAVTKMSVLSFLCFLVCWSPYIILHVVIGENQKPGTVAAFLLVFAFSSSVFNPFIYAGINKNFRRVLPM